MAIFKKIMDEIDREEDAKKEWIWVEGYKGTDANMTCRNQQYKLGETYFMPDDAEIELCKTGYHLCLKLEDVFHYYNIGSGKRYFKVKALVRAEDVAEYDSMSSDKLVAKAITFLEELGTDEILKGQVPEDWDEELKQIAINKSISAAHERVLERELIALGYSEPMVIMFISNRLCDYAKALGSQEGLSMEFKIGELLSLMKDRAFQMYEYERNRGRRNPYGKMF